MCSLLFNNCIYFIVLLLFNVNLCSCMPYPIQNTNNKNKISDWFQGLKSGLSFVLIYVFFYNRSKKKYVYFCINSFPFLETITETFLIQLNGTKIIKKKHLTLTFTKNEFPITQQGLLFFRAESLQFTSFPA